MKNIIVLLLVSSFLFIGCNNNKPKDSVTITSTDGKEQVTINPNEMQNAAMDIQKVKDDLGKLTPLSIANLKLLVPKELMEAAASDVDVNDAMGTSVASAGYKINDSTGIKLEIVDCAGPGGGGFFVMQYADILDDVEESDDETTFKIIDFNGYKAFESCMKSRPDDCTFTYFDGNRFLISLQGKNVGIDKLKGVAKALNIK